MPTTHRARIGVTYDSPAESNVDTAIKATATTLAGTVNVVGTYCTVATANLLVDTTDLIVSVFNAAGAALAAARYVRIEIFRPTGAINDLVALATNGACTRAFGSGTAGQFLFLTNASGVATIEMSNAGTNGIVHHTFASVANAPGAASGVGPDYLAITL